MKIKVTKAGYDALTEPNVNNYIFHSDYNTFKIVKSGTGSFTVTASSSEEKTITHNYGTRVGFMVFFKHPNNRITYMNNAVDDASSSSSLWVWTTPPISNTTNTINLKVMNTSGTNKTLYYKYYLFEIPL